MITACYVDVSVSVIWACPNGKDSSMQAVTQENINFLKCLAGPLDHCERSLVFSDRIRLALYGA